MVAINRYNKHKSILFQLIYAIIIITIIKLLTFIILGILFKQYEGTSMIFITNVLYDLNQ